MNMNNKPSRMVPFILGLILGVLGTIFLPGYATPYLSSFLPDWAVGKTTVVKGTVIAKLKKDNVLMLTVNTPQGELLATFTHKVVEIGLLVNEKDVLEFTLPKYMPFIEDPRIIRVAKEQPAEPEPAPPQPAPKKEGGGRKGGGSGREL